MAFWRGTVAAGHLLTAAYLSSREREVTPHSVGQANCVLMVGGRDSTRSQSGSHFEKWGSESLPSGGFEWDPTRTDQSSLS